MFKISDIEKSYISMYDTRNEEISYFFSVVNVDRKYVDDSFTHHFGIHRCRHSEFEFKLKFDEALDDEGSRVILSATKIDFLTKEAEDLMNEMNEDEDVELFNKLYF